MSTEVAEESTDKKESSDEVEIKEEPAEVVEISSEDEKPRIKDLPGNKIIKLSVFLLHTRKYDNNKKNKNLN